VNVRRILYKGALHAVKPFIIIGRKAPSEIKRIANRRAIVSGVISLDGQRHFIGDTNEHTLFRTASLTKLVTALGVMKSGINLDAPLSPLTGLPLKNITLRQLMSHTSPLYDGEAYERSLAHPIPLDILLKSPTVWKKEEGFRYSNFGFGIVGSVLEAVMGESLEKYMQRTVFMPLNLNCTYDITAIPFAKNIYRLVPPKKEFNFSERKKKASPILSADPLRHFTLAAGNLFADTASLEKVLALLISNDGSFINKEAITQMKTIHAEYGVQSPNLAYGLGFLIVRGKETLYGHQGFAYGCVNGMFFSEESGKALVSLNNGADEMRSGRMGHLNQELIDWGFS